MFQAPIFPAECPPWSLEGRPNPILRLVALFDLTPSAAAAAAEQIALALVSAAADSQRERAAGPGGEV